MDKQQYIVLGITFFCVIGFLIGTLVLRNNSLECTNNPLEYSVKKLDRGNGDLVSCSCMYYKDGDHLTVSESNKIINVSGLL